MLDRTPPGAKLTSRPGPAEASLTRLRALLDAGGPTPTPSFLILCGDEVYVDATAGFFDPRKLDSRLGVAYEALLGSHGFRSIVGRLPTFCLLDDHEISNDWEPPPDAEATQADFASMSRAVDVFNALLRGVPPRGDDGAVPPVLWSTHEVEGFKFFLGDTRTDRSPRTALTAGSASLMQPPQRRALSNWLAADYPGAPGPHPRVIVTSAMLLPRTLASVGPGASLLESDGWDGYPATRNWLLNRLYQHGASDVIFLSGDAHLGNVARIELTRSDDPEKKVVAHSMHCPALYAPYPFANAVAEDFLAEDAFEIPGAAAGTTLTCAVSTWFPPPGDGFVTIDVRKGDDGWMVNARFFRASNPMSTCYPIRIP